MRRRLMVFLLIAAGSIFQGDAKEKDRLVELRFVPQEATSGANPTLPPELTTHPVRLLLEDGRTVADKTIIGEGTGDDDELFAWRTTSDVEAFARGVFEQVSAGWGIVIDPNSPLLLRLRLRHFWTSERDQAVGSFYVAEVRVIASLEGSGKHVLANSNGFGDARRYGRKRSAENSSEVLSDALKEAYASLLTVSELQSAWAGKSTTKSTAASVDPGTLLSEVVKLRDQGFGVELLIQFVSQRTLSRQLSAEDLIAWKEAQVPEGVIQAVLGRPVAP